MSEIVFILGAGASASAGAPITSDFFSKATTLLRSGQLSSNDVNDFKLVFEARDILQRVQAKSFLNLNNIEEVFGAFEMVTVFNRLGELKTEQIDRLQSAMCTVIAKTIEYNLIFPVSNTKIQNAVAVPTSTGGLKVTNQMPKVYSPYPYGSFTELIGKLTENNKRKVSILTFNYDLALDFSLQYHGLGYSYCFNDDVKSFNSIELLKLHGSFNWGKCDNCKQIFIWDMNNYLNRFQWGDLAGLNETRLHMTTHLPLYTHCNGKESNAKPLIVPPTFNKGTYHKELAHVWSRAAQHLSEAEKIYILGYSYPDTDEFFKFLYSIGSIGSGWLSRFLVCNPDTTIKSRYQDLLGQQVKHGFDLISNKFDSAISVISKELGVV